VEGKLTPPCPRPSDDTRPAKLAFDTAKGEHAELMTTMFVIDPSKHLTTASAPTPAPTQAAPVPWDAKKVAALAKQLPAPDAPDQTCPDDHIRDFKRRYRVHMTVFERDDILTTAKLPPTNKACRSPRLLTGDVPHLFLVDVASVCVSPKLVDEHSAVAGSEKGLVAVVDGDKMQVLCHVQFSAASSISASGEKKYGGQVAIDSDFDNQRYRARKAALAKVSRFLENEASTIDRPDMDEKGTVW
jgi:hypothetical protein